MINILCVSLLTSSLEHHQQSFKPVFPGHVIMGIGFLGLDCMFICTKQALVTCFNAENRFDQKLTK